MRILVACEFSGVVRRAFACNGHDVHSCDLLPAEDRTPNHWQTDVRNILGLDWDLMVAHPPCTHLAVSGARWFKDKKEEQAEALDFVRELLDAPIPKICIENPVSVIASHIRPADQTIQPWQFGHAESKAICLWLKGLPKLKPTKVLEKEAPPLFPDTETVEIRDRIHRQPPGPDRWKRRSRFYDGVAKAMAGQWP